MPPVLGCTAGPGFRDGETLDLGEHKLRFMETPHVLLEEPFAYRGLLFGRAIGAQQAPGR